MISGNLFLWIEAQGVSVQEESSLEFLQLGRGVRTVWIYTVIPNYVVSKNLRPAWATVTSQANNTAVECLAMVALLPHEASDHLCPPHHWERKIGPLTANCCIDEHRSLQFISEECAWTGMWSVQCLCTDMYIHIRGVDLFLKEWVHVRNWCTPRPVLQVCYSVHKGTFVFIHGDSWR